MKNVFKKSNIFSFILGAVIFTGITSVAAYTILANDIGYTPRDTNWQVDNVKDAIDDLYSKAKPEYTGITTVTPTTSSQTLSTKNKILKSNITIDPIPPTYKNLTTTTTVDSSNLLSGIKAYDSDGNLITGNISTDCVSGSFTFTQNDMTNGKILTSFAPNYFSMYMSNSSVGEIIAYYNKNINSQNVYQTNINGSSVTNQKIALGTTYTINNNLKIKFASANWLNQTLYYMACK